MLNFRIKKELSKLSEVCVYLQKKDAFKPFIGKNGGRKFQISLKRCSKTFVMKDLLYRVFQLAHQAKRKSDRDDLENLRVILPELRKLDKEGDIVLGKATRKQKILTRIRQIFGNFCRNKKEIFSKLNALLPRRNADDYFLIGQKHIQNSNIKEAILYFNFAANYGHVKAMLALARIFQQGLEEYRDEGRAFELLKKAAATQDPIACKNLGLCFLEGKGVDQNTVSGLFWLMKVAEQGDIESQYEIARIFHEGKNIKLDKKKAIPWFEKMIETYSKKNAPSEKDKELTGMAALCLGHLYYDGKDVLQDFPKARGYFLKATNHSISAGAYNLGKMYLQGLGGAVDKEAGVFLIEQAASLGLTNALFQMGSFYENGIYKPKDSNAALNHYREASEKGHVPSQYKEARLLLKMGQEKERAKTLLQAAADQNHTEAQFQLGMLLEQEKESIHYLTLAADKGRIDANYELGKRYAESEGSKDVDKAVKYLKYASRKGNISATIQLGHVYHYLRKYSKALAKYVLAADAKDPEGLYYRGWYWELGFVKEKKDLFLAYKYYLESAELEYPQALTKVGQLYLAGKGAPKSLPDAIKFFKKADKFNENEAQFELGFISETILKKSEAAIKWYKKASQNGNEEAKKRLEELENT